MPAKDNLKDLEYNKLYPGFIKIKSIHDCNIESWLSLFTSDKVYSDYSWDNWGWVSNCIEKKYFQVLPKYLIIRLIKPQVDKSYAQQSSINNGWFVDFPKEGLDLSNFYSGDKSRAKCIYDLYGVINHHHFDGRDNYYSTIKDYMDSDNWYMFRSKFSTWLTLSEYKIRLLWFTLF